MGYILFWHVRDGYFVTEYHVSHIDGSIDQQNFDNFIRKHNAEVEKESPI
jgi:hypothetical protein